MKTSICVFFLLACLQIQAEAAFPPQYYPSSGHPRLWLTSERLGAIENSRMQHTARWQEFQALCNSLIDNDPSNDPWNVDIAPQHYTAPLALMYRLSGDSRYAERAIELVDKTTDDFSQYGDPDHENFYFLGLTYDWLYDYSGMTPEKKEAFRNKMIAISTKFWNDYNLTASGTDSDQNLLTGMTHLVMGTAMYGDTPAAVTLLDRGWKGWEEGYFLTAGISNRDLIKAALGGAYFTGMAYFPSTDIIGIAGYWLTLNTACNYDINTMEPELRPFWANVIRSIIHLTEPGRERIYPYGSWQDPNILHDQPWMQRAITIASYFADQTGFHHEAALARGYAADVDIGYHNDAMLELFYTTPGAAAISPYTSDMPLVRFAREPDFLFFRDNWSPTAKWGLFAGDGSIPCDHQTPDHGHFALWRENSYLTRGVRTYDALGHGDFFNTLSIENRCSVNGQSCSGTAIFNSEEKASIARHRTSEGSPLFVYAMLQADGQWNDSPSEYQAWTNVTTYRRHFFWAGDCALVFDRLRTKNPGWAKYRLRALTEPSILGNTVSQLSPDGRNRLLQQTLEPAGVTITKVDESVEWSGLPDWIVDTSERKWQSVIEIAPATRINILNALKMGPASMTDFEHLEYLGSADNTGARIENWVVCFSPEETLRREVSYSIHNSEAGMWHLVADLKPGAYRILAGNQTIQNVYVNEGDNTALFQTSDIVQVLEINVKPSSLRGDVNHQDGINIVDALLTARYAAGLNVTGFDVEAANVNCSEDGVNIIDALLIARKSVGLSVPGWCPF